MARFLRGDYRQLFAGAPRAPREGAWVFCAIAGVQGALFSLLAFFGHPWLYLGLWLLPALTLLHCFGRIRAIMEHAGYGPGEDQTRSARTIPQRSWQTFFFGPHAIHFHIEHHQYAAVPFYRLRDVHQWMAARGQLPAANLYRGYGQILREVTRAPGPANPSSTAAG